MDSHAARRELLAAAGEVARPRLAECTPRDLCNLAWGMATLGCQDRALLGLLADAATARIGEFNAQECSKLLFALNKAGVQCDR